MSKDVLALVPVAWKCAACSKMHVQLCAWLQLPVLFYETLDTHVSMQVQVPTAFYL